MSKINIGDVFGKLKVLESTYNIRKSGRKNKAWVCICECGKTSVCETNTLTSGHSKSCGCERLKSISKSHGSITGTWYGLMQKNSKKRGFEFNLTKEFLQKLIEKQQYRCAISNLEIDISKKRSGKHYYKETTASLDRIDNKLGYEEDNVQFVHKHINYMKWTHDQEYFIKLCKYVVENDTNRKLDS